MNKVETGVRAIHIPTGTAVVSTEARSQHMNKQIALNRLCEILAEMNLESGRRERTWPGWNTPGWNGGILFGSMKEERFTARGGTVGIKTNGA